MKGRSLFSFATSLLVFGATLPTLAQSRSTIESLPNGNYIFCRPINEPDQRCFYFRKAGNQITGTLSQAEDGICLTGRVNNNTVSGQALENVGQGFFDEPQRVSPNFRGSRLRTWHSMDEIKVAIQSVINTFYGTEFNRPRYRVSYRYQSALLDLRGYQLESTDVGSPANCEPN